MRIQQQHRKNELFHSKRYFFCCWLLCVHYFFLHIYFSLILSLLLLCVCYVIQFSSFPLLFCNSTFSLCSNLCSRVIVRARASFFFIFLWHVLIVSATHSICMHFFEAINRLVVFTAFFKPILICLSSSAKERRNIDSLQLPVSDASEKRKENGRTAVGVRVTQSL